MKTKTFSLYQLIFGRNNELDHELMINNTNCGIQLMIRNTNYGNKFLR